MSLGIDGERAMPPSRVEQEGRREVLGQIRPDAADLTQRFRPNGIVRSDAYRSESCVVA